MNTVLVANRKGGVGKTMVAVTLASALARRGARVALADADRQGSALIWLGRRPVDAPSIKGVDWTSAGEIGSHPKKLDWLVIDAPGALREGRAEKLIAEARAIFVPIQPGMFDQASTERFLEDIEGVKRVRKGKVPVHLVVNRVRARSRAARALDAYLKEMGREPVARLADRSAYGDLAAGGLSVFDSNTAASRALQSDWAGMLTLLGAEV